MEEKNIIQQIKAEAQRLGYSDYKIAELSGLNRSTVGRVLNEKFSPKMETVEVIAKALGLQLGIKKK